MSTERSTRQTEQTVAARQPTDVPVAVADAQVLLVEVGGQAYAIGLRFVLEVLPVMKIISFTFSFVQLTGTVRFREYRKILFGKRGSYAPGRRLKGPLRLSLSN